MHWSPFPSHTLTSLILYDFFGIFDDVEELGTGQEGVQKGHHTQFHKTVQPLSLEGQKSPKFTLHKTPFNSTIHSGPNLKLN